MTMPRLLVLALALAAGCTAVATAPLADGGQLTCGDLRRASEAVCRAKYQCSAIEPQLTQWKEKLCACLADKAPDDQGVAMPLDSFNPVGFGCCAGTAIDFNPAICEKIAG